MKLIVCSTQWLSGVTGFQKIGMPGFATELAPPPMMGVPELHHGLGISQKFPERLAIHRVAAMLPFFYFLKHVFLIYPHSPSQMSKNFSAADPIQDRRFMQRALDLACQAFRGDEVPVGAVLIHKGEILATGYNQREGTQDPTAHAELNAIRSAAVALGSWRLTDTTLYVTLEPCAMCAGAIIQARIGRVVFGTWDPKAGACGSICNLLVEPRFNHRVLIESDVLAGECRSLLQKFFQKLRSTPQVPAV